MIFLVHISVHAVESLSLSGLPEPGVPCGAASLCLLKFALKFHADLDQVLIESVSLSPPMEIALRIASSNPLDSNTAMSACGTVP